MIIKPEIVIKSGWLNIFKEEGYTSTKIVRSLKKKFKIKKIGHYGTLDPLASGVLPIAIGEATKTIRFITNNEKNYTFIVNWGKETDTCDNEGKVVNETSKRPSEKEVKEIIDKYFIGEIFQRPPLFSAVKINGKRAYELARQNIKFETSLKKIKVFKFNLLETEGKNSSKFFINCGPGTYVRSIARDIAKKLGTLGYASDIIRLKNSYFTIINAINFQEIINMNKIALNDIMLPVDFALKNIQEIKLEKEYADMLKNGKLVFMKRYNTKKIENAYFLIKNKSKLVSIANLKKGYIIPRRNFNN